MKNKRISAVRLTAHALCLLLSPSFALALGLGTLQVDSRIGEPLNLYIELLSADSKDLTSLSAGLASQEDFSRIGVPYPEQAEKIRFQVEDNRGIRLTSEKPVDAAYLHLLVAATWAGGKVVREYTALLDPPLYKGRASVAKRLPEVAARAPIQDAVPSPVAAPSESVPWPTKYEVRGGDSLSGIVKRLKLDRRVSNHQAMMSLYKANPDAFAGHINLLKRGAALTIPLAKEMAVLDPKEAQAEFSAQLTRSQNKQPRKPVVATPLPTQAIAEQAEAEVRAAAGPGNDAPEQAASAAEEEIQSDGTTEKIEAQTETASPQESASGDRLRIGQMQAEFAEPTDSGVPPAAVDSAELQSLRSRVTDLDESLVASRLENEELRDTIRGIERQLAQLTRLLTLENQMLALNQGVATQAAEDQTGAETDIEPAAVDGTQVSAAGETPAAEATVAGEEELAARDLGAFDDVLDGVPEHSPVAVAESADGASVGESEVPVAVAGDVLSVAGEPLVPGATGSEPTSVQAQDGTGVTMAEAEELSTPNVAALGDAASFGSQSVAAGEGSVDPSTKAATAGEDQRAPASDTSAATVAGQAQLTALPATDHSGVAGQSGQEAAQAASAATAEADVVDAEEVQEESPGAVRSVSDRGIVDTLKGVPQLAVGTFKALPETERRIAGGIGVLIGGLAALGLVRRRQSRKPAPASPGKSEAKGVPASPLGGAAASGGIMLSLDDEKPAEEETQELAAETLTSADLVAEAEAYIAYDHDDQAIRVLQEAWESKPDEEVGLKLLELHHKHGDRRAFSGLAEEFYLQIGGDSPAWSEIAEKGRKLNPENPLFAASPASEITAEVRTTEANSPAEREPARIELDEIGLDDLQPLHGESEAGRRVEPGELKLSLGEEIGNAETGESPGQNESADFGPASGDAGTAAAQMDALSHADDGDEQESALELAEAYLDLDEKEVARSFIDEVMLNGSERQKQIAAKLAEKLS